jgi:hypothetical protein
MPIGIYTKSEEHKRKISRTLTGRKQIRSEEGKILFREKMKGRKRPSFSKEWCKKISKGKKGQKHSEEWKQQNSVRMKIIARNDGRKPPVHKGENCHFWKGGITDYPYPQDWTETLRESIRQRDNYMCKICGVHQDELNRALHIHHIDYNKENCNPVNLITLCCSCHVKTNNNREYWLDYFRRDFRWM